MLRQISFLASMCGHRLAATRPQSDKGKSCLRQWNKPTRSFSTTLPRMYTCMSSGEVLRCLLSYEIVRPV